MWWPFSQRGYKYRDPDGGPHRDPTLSRMTIVTMGMSGCWSRSGGSSRIKLVDVLKVCDLSEGDTSRQEIALVKAPPVVHVTN